MEVVIAVLAFLLVGVPFCLAAADFVAAASALEEARLRRIEGAEEVARELDEFIRYLRDTSWWNPWRWFFWR